MAELADSGKLSDEFAEKLMKSAHTVIDQLQATKEEA
jgi:hypothetical protein